MVLVCRRIQKVSLLFLFFLGFVVFTLIWFGLFTQTSTSVLLRLPFVMSMQSVRILMDLIAAPARLVTLVTAKLAKVGGATVCTAWSQLPTALSKHKFIALFSDHDYPEK